MSDRLDHLLDLYLLDEATRAERIELVELLRADAGHRRRLVDRVTLEAHLYRAVGDGAKRTIEVGEPVEAALAGSAVELAQPSTRQARRPAGPLVLRWAIRGSIAAAVLLAVALAAWFAWPRPTAPQAAGARLTGGQIQLRRPDGSLASAPAGPLAVGSVVRAVGDVPAVLRLSDESVVRLSPSAEAILRGPAGEARELVVLTAGEGAFVAAFTSGGGVFRVDTPGGSVLSANGEFTVRLRPHGRLSESARGADFCEPRRPESGWHGPVLRAVSANDRRHGPEYRTVPPGTESLRPARATEPAGEVFLVSHDDGIDDADGESADVSPATSPAAPPDLFVSVRSGTVRVERAGRRFDLSAAQARVFRNRDASKPAEGRRVDATVGAVDPVERTVQLRRTGDGERVISATTYVVHDDAALTVDGRPATLADLRPGMRVQARESDDAAADADEVVRVDARGRDVSGTLMSATAGTVTVRPGRGKTEPQTYPLARGATATLDERPVAFSDLPVGSAVVVRLSADERSVVQVQAGKPVRRDGDRGK